MHLVMAVLMFCLTKLVNKHFNNLGACYSIVFTKTPCLLCITTHFMTVNFTIILIKISQLYDYGAYRYLKLKFKLTFARTMWYS